MNGLKLTCILGILFGTTIAYCQEKTIPNNYDEIELQENSYLYPEEETERPLYPEEEETWEQGQPLPDDTQYFNPTEEFNSF